MSMIVSLRPPRGRRSRLVEVGVLIAALLPALGVPAAAQYNTAPLPAAWAIEGATVVHAGSRVETDVTVVVRGGLIETLRAGAPVPEDARRIEAPNGGLHVYPGFVDAHGSAATTFPTPSREGVFSWNPTREVQFFTPRREAGNYLSTNGEGLASERRRGVVASAVFPGRGVMPGQPSVILHRSDARTSSELVARSSIGLAAAWQGAQGAYPGTLMAQHAFLRQAFLDAEHYRAHRDAWARDPRGMTPVTPDPDLEMVLRAQAGDLPVYFHANGVEEIRRVLRLADELSFRPIIVGGQEAGALADELRARGIAVLLDADFPSTNEWEIDEEENGDLSPAAFRERRRLEPIFRTPERLAAAGVPFAFTSGGEASTDLLRGARRAIEFGLDEQAALRALTAGPAELLDVPHLARIEEGMGATFIVTDGPLFEEGVRITWTFVNGRAEAGREPRNASAPDADGEAGDPAALEALSGTWTGTITAMGQGSDATIEFSVGDDGEISGTMSTTELPSQALRGISVDDDRLRFELVVPQFGDAVMTFDGALDDGRYSGTGGIQVAGESISFTFEFRRAPGGALR